MFVVAAVAVPMSRSHSRATMRLRKARTVSALPEGLWELLDEALDETPLRWEVCRVELGEDRLEGGLHRVVLGVGSRPISEEAGVSHEAVDPAGNGPRR